MPVELGSHGLRQPESRPEIPGAPGTVAAVLDPVLAVDPNREALVGRHGRLSYRDLDGLANRAAYALAELGVRPGDRVAACLPNDVDIVVACFGTLRLGAIWVGVNRPLAPPEKVALLNDCGAVVFLAAPDMAEQVARSRERLDSLEHLIAVERGSGGGGGGGGGGKWGSRLAAASDSPRPDVAIDPFGPAAIAYTSGTTGTPKGAVHSQHNLLLPGAVTRASGRYPPELRLGCVLPLTILNLMVLSPLVAYQIGSCCVAIDRIDPRGLAEWVRKERVGHFAGVPTILHDLLTHPGVKAEDLASLVCPEVGGAECPEGFRDLYRERFGSEVSIGYGMTEAPSAVTRAVGKGEPVPGLCGKALPQVEIEIRAAEGDEVLPAGEVGEICVRPARTGPWAGVYTPMLGYWNRPEATAEALRGGVYRSGDLGFLEPDGTLFIRGRRNEMILRGGANVYPAEIERVIQEDERVAACAVLGAADERLGQRVVAAVQPVPGAQISAEELRSRVGKQLARYKVPEQIEFVEALPRNAMSKVIKRELAPLFEGSRERETQSSKTKTSKVK